MRGNIVYTPLGNTCTTLTGGKIPLGRRSGTPISALIAYLALSTARAMLL